jgi:hypothetical protein
MPVSEDSVHICPVCGSPWVIRIGSDLPGRSAQPRDRSWCSARACPATTEQVALYRAVRERMGWDRWPR